MLGFRFRLSQFNNLFLICSLLLAAGFMLEIKVLYSNHQRALRFKEYNLEVKEYTEMISALEKISNHTNLLMGKLEKVIKQKKKRRDSKVAIKP